MDCPDSFMIHSNTGVFVMSRTDRGYSGTANGVTCKLSLGDDIQAVLISGTDLPFDAVSGSFPFTDANRLSEELSEWIDGNCWEYIVENAGRDFRRFATKNGNLAYYAYNTHLGGTPLIFLHGGPGGDSNTIRPRSLMLDNPVYMYDQMGCGNSDPIPDLSEWNHEDYFEELNEFIEGMGFEKVILVGASWGSGLAVGYAARFGCGRIESMILPSPFLSSELWVEDQWKNISKLSPEYQKEIGDYCKGIGTIENYRHFMAEYDSHYLFSQPENREIAVGAAQEEQSEVFKAMCGTNEMLCAGNMKDFDVVDSLKDIDVPVLMMVGDSDEVTIETAERFNELMPRSRLIVVEGAGHALAFEQFESYKDNILSFLGQRRS